MKKVIIFLIYFYLSLVAYAADDFVRSTSNSINERFTTISFENSRIRIYKTIDNNSDSVSYQIQLLEGLNPSDRKLIDSIACEVSQWNEVYCENFSKTNNIKELEKNLIYLHNLAIIDGIFIDLPDSTIIPHVLFKLQGLNCLSLNVGHYIEFPRKIFIDCIPKCFRIRNGESPAIIKNIGNIIKDGNFGILSIDAYIQNFDEVVDELSSANTIDQLFIGLNSFIQFKANVLPNDFFNINAQIIYLFRVDFRNITGNAPVSKSITFCSIDHATNVEEFPDYFVFAKYFAIPKIFRFETIPPKNIFKEREKQIRRKLCKFLYRIDLNE